MAEPLGLFLDRFVPRGVRMAEASRSWKDSLVYAVLSDVGMRRANNQDSQTVVLADEMNSYHERGHLFMVADGMGAHAAGELASQLAVENVAHHYLKLRDLSRAEALERAVHETNALVHKRGQANAEFHNMGTTSSTLLLTDAGALVAHVGDSRVYRLRSGRLEQLTFDHSLVWEMRALGQMPEDAELARAIPKNVITRSLGPNATLQVDLEGPFPIEIGDVFLLCSDGLTGQVKDEEIGPLLAALDPAEAAQVLVDLANLRGGPDNITVIVVKATGPAIETRNSAGNAHRKAAAKPPIHPIVWIVLGVCLLAAMVLLMTENLIPAFAAVVIGIVTVLIGVVQRLSASGGATTITSGAPHGNGPYRSVPLEAGASFVGTLREIIEQLREAALEREWEVDFKQLDRFLELADEATGANRSSEAVRQYAGAVRFMMQELRNQNKRKASDSTIDY